MKASKFMMSLSAAVFGGVMYMQIAGACSRMQAAVLGTAMLVCMALLCGSLWQNAAGQQSGPQGGPRPMDKAAHIAYRADLMSRSADGRLEENRQKFQMPHDRVERCMRYVKAVEKQSERLKAKSRSATGACARNGEFDALLERWQARQEAKNRRAAMQI
ncbi:MAG: hypothetical protein ACLRVN_01480 [Butyricicoccus sp.]